MGINNRKLYLLIPLLLCGSLAKNPIYAGVLESDNNNDQRLTEKSVTEEEDVMEEIVEV